MKTKAKTTIRPFDATNYLQTEEDIAMYLASWKMTIQRCWLQPLEILPEPEG